MKKKIKHSHLLYLITIFAFYKESHSLAKASPELEVIFRPELSSRYKLASQTCPPLSVPCFPRNMMGLLTCCGFSISR